MKKIHSSVKFDDDTFKITIGTTDKKFPSTIYAEIGTYIIPSKFEESYDRNIEIISKDIKSYTKKIIKSNAFCLDDFIMVTDVADERIREGKKSYFKIQIHFKPTLDSLTKYNKNFKKISEEANGELVSNILPFVKNSIYENGFNCSKLKN